MSDRMTGHGPLLGGIAMWLLLVVGAGIMLGGSLAWAGSANRLSPVLAASAVIAGAALLLFAGAGLLALERTLRRRAAISGGIEASAWGSRRPRPPRGVRLRQTARIAFELTGPANSR